MEQDQNKRLILGIVVFLTLASFFFIELIFGVFAMTSAWIWGLLMNLFHWQINFWHTTIFNFFTLNLTIGFQFFKRKRKNDKL